MSLEKKYELIKMILNRYNYSNSFSDSVFTLGKSKNPPSFLLRQKIAGILMLLVGILFLILSEIILGVCLISVGLFILFYIIDHSNDSSVISETTFHFSKEGITVVDKHDNSDTILSEDIISVSVESNLPNHLEESDLVESRSLPVTYFELSIQFLHKDEKKSIKVLKLVDSESQYIIDDIEKIRLFVISVLEKQIDY